MCLVGIGFGLDEELIVADRFQRLNCSFFMGGCSNRYREQNYDVWVCFGFLMRNRQGTKPENSE